MLHLKMDANSPYTVHKNPTLAIFQVCRSQMRANVQGAGRKVFIHSSSSLALNEKSIHLWTIWIFYLMNWLIQFTKTILMIFSGSWVGSIVRSPEHLRLKTLIHTASAEDLWAYESCGCFYEFSASLLRFESIQSTFIIITWKKPTWNSCKTFSCMSCRKIKYHSEWHTVHFWVNYPF